MIFNFRLRRINYISCMRGAEGGEGEGGAGEEGVGEGGGGVGGQGGGGGGERGWENKEVKEG